MLNRSNATASVRKMSTPSSQDIRKYGLEFINDLAKDREVAVQSLGVAFSAMKTELRSSKILTRSNEFKYIDNLMKRFREEVNRNFESQLTRITIKSLGWLKRVMKGEQILVSDDSREEELQQIINDLSRQLKLKSAELSKLSEIAPKITQDKVLRKELKEEYKDIIADAIYENMIEAEESVQEDTSWIDAGRG